MKKFFYVLIICGLGATSLRPSGPFGEVTKHLAGPIIFEPGLEGRRKLLAELEKERDHLEATQPEFVAETEKEIASVENQIALVRQELKQQPDDELLLKKQSLLNDRLQLLNDKIKVRKQLIEDKNELIKITADFLADPNLEDFKREQKLFDVTTYTFEDIQTLKQKVLEAKKNISFWENQEKNINAQAESRKRIIASLEESFKKKKEEFEAAMEAESQPFGLDKRQRREMFSLEERVYKDKEELEKLRLNEIETKKSLIKKKKIVAEAQLNVLKAALERSKALIRITEADIADAKDELTKKEREYYGRRETFSKELERRKPKERELEALSKRFNIPLGPDLDDWSREPKQTVEGYSSLFEVGEFNDQVLLVHLEKLLLEARMDLEKERLEQDSLLVTIKETYYKITARFKSIDEITEEINKYEALKARSQAAISEYESKKSTAADRLSIQKKALENIRERRREVEKQENILFKNFPRDFSKIISLLNSIEENILNQINELGKIIDVYADIININKSNLQQIDLVVPDLPGTLQLLRRPETAISWKAIRSIMPDIRMFLSDLYNYITSLSVESLVIKIKMIISKPYDLILFFIQLLLLAILLLLLRVYLPRVADLLRQLEVERYWLRSLILLFSFTSNFLVTYFLGITLWVLSFFTFYNLKVIDPYLTVIFYLGSIPYLLYFAMKFIGMLIQFNEQQGYCFLREQFQRRFSLVLSFSLYATICISLFRESFQLLISLYPKSELPRTLGVINVIIVQLAVIFLLSKEQILGLIPTANQIGRTIRAFVDAYYYLLLPFGIAIIIMSNPYVGYGPLVWYVLKRLLYTLLVIAFLYWLHIFLKRVSSKIFFSVREEVVKERFSYAKTWYGFFVILVFISLILIGIFVGAKIWSWPEPLARITSWEDIRSWVYIPFAFGDTEAPISIASIIQFFIIILIGALVSYAFNRFVLGRIFDVLLVEPGVQNAVVTLTRYLIIFTAFIFAIQAVGIGQLAWWLGVGLLGIGWIVKDPLIDFIAYMIILVQRPLKIGDYVKLDEDTRGVVRKITARAVILRRKNSVTYIVPNSQIIKKVLINWNYRPGFVAFDDILINISYRENPAIVREILLQALDENPYILKSPKPIVRLDNFGENGYVFMVRGFVSSNYTLEIWNIASAIRIEMVHALRKHDIDLAVPIRKIIEFSKEASSQQLLDEKRDDIDR